jgi:hypothetical protein
LFVTSTTFAATDYHLGVAGGATIPNVGDTVATLAVEGGAKLTSYAGVGLHASYAQKKTELVTARQYNVLAQGDLYLSVLHAGVNAGLGVVSVGQDGVPSQNTTSLVYGPEAGFDVPLADKCPVSIGAEVHYLLSTADNAPKNVQTLASLKLHL